MGVASVDPALDVEELFLRVGVRRTHGLEPSALLLLERELGIESKEMLLLDDAFFEEEGHVLVKGSGLPIVRGRRVVPAHLRARMGLVKGMAREK